ncbi:EF-hand domain-containing protein [Pontiellaceae bacterium B1224]|nr:EF-hand domain-containing protein [Pontiellaceae bacterium B1224]
MKTQAILILLLAAGTTMAAQNNQQQGAAPSASDMITRLDKDNDGKISKSEFDGPDEHFTTFDIDGDGYLITTEIPSGPPQQQQGQQGQGQQQPPQQGQQSGSSADFVTRLDKDNDGKVSSTEFDGPANAFSELDKNSDGYLSSDEAPSGPPPRGQR